MAWHCDGVNDSVTMGDHAALTLTRSTGWTVAGWYNYHATGSGRYAHLLSWNPWAGNDSFNVYIDTDDDGLTAGAYKTVSPVNHSYDLDVYTATQDVWEHIAILLDANGSAVKTYKNGVYQGAGNAGLTSDVDAGASWLWGAESGPTDHLEVDLAEWGKWDRPLSPDEIHALGAHGFAPSCFPRSLAWYVPMFGGRYQEWCVPLALTNSGSTSTDHPGKLIYPGRPRIAVPGPVAGKVPWHLFFGRAA